MFVFIVLIVKYSVFIYLFIYL